MTRQLVIHIGAIKTGSSAIQQFLGENAPILRGKGVLIPDQRLTLVGDITGDQVPYFDERRHRSDAERRQELTDHIDALFEAGDVQRVVISAENLSEGDMVAAPWFADVARKYDAEVIAYLRRQDEVLLAAWQQWDAKVESDFWGWLISRVGILADWRRVLERWEAVVGRDRMRVRLYERRRLADGDVVPDFEDVLGTREYELRRNPGLVVNPSFSDVVADLVPGGGFFRDVNDYDFYNLITDLTGDRFYRNRSESPISHRQRLAIISRYAESNEWVRETYFRDEELPGTLFELPQPGEYHLRDHNDLRREQIQLVARMLFELTKRFQ